MLKLPIGIEITSPLKGCSDSSMGESAIINSAPNGHGGAATDSHRAHQAGPPFRPRIPELHMTLSVSKRNFSRLYPDILVHRIFVANISPAFHLARIDNAVCLYQIGEYAGNAATYVLSA